MNDIRKDILKKHISLYDMSYAEEEEIESSEQEAHDLAMAEVYERVRKKYVQDDV